MKTKRKKKLILGIETIRDLNSLSKVDGGTSPSVNITACASNCPVCEINGC